MQGDRRSLWAFRIFAFLFWFSNYVLNPYMSPYAKSLGANNITIGFIVSAYSIAQIALKLPLGIVSDRIGRKKCFIVVGAAITFVSELGMFISASVGGLMAFRLLQGIAVAAWVCSTVLYASYLPPKQAVTATVHLQICNSAGTLTGYFLGGFITQKFGYRSVFLLATVGAAMSFAVTLFLREEKNGAQKSTVSAKEMILIAKSPFLLLVTGVCMMGQMILATTSWGFTPTLAVGLGADSQRVSLISVCFSVPQLLCALFVTRPLVARWGEKRVIILATAMEAVFCITQPYMPSLALLGLNAACSGFFHTLSYSVLLGLSIRPFPKRMRAVANGFMQSCYCIGLFIGPVISGWFGDTMNLRAGFTAVGIISLLAPAATALLYDRCEKSTLAQITS